MSLTFISNFAANIARRHVGANDTTATSSLAKLSAGTRVLSAKDDAASLAVGSRLTAEIGGLKQAAVNAGQAATMLQIAEGAMAKTNELLVRMKSLAVQSASGQLSATERSMLDTEYQALVSEVDRIAHDTAFAGTLLVHGEVNIVAATAPTYELQDGVRSLKFLGEHNDATAGLLRYATSGLWSAAVRDGTSQILYTGSLPPEVHNGTNMYTGTVVKLTNVDSNDTVEVALNRAFQVSGSVAVDAGAIGRYLLERTNIAGFTYKVGTGVVNAADDIAVTVNSINAQALGIDPTDITTASQADLASAAVDDAIDDLQSHRAAVGANQNRLGYAIANLAIVQENTDAARSQLLDLDAAAELSRFTSNQILVESGVSMLAQANLLPRSLLGLFS